MTRPARDPISLVPEGRHFEGLVVFFGDGALEGDVRGEVRASGSLRLGSNSRVTGPVYADEVELTGQLEGYVVARRLAKLTEGATLRGTLSSPKVFVADGARIQGACRIGSL